MLSLFQPKCTGNRTGYLSDFQRMSQAGAVVVAIMIYKHLGLVLEPAEGVGVDDAVAVPAEGAAGPARRLGVLPAAAVVRIAAIGCAGSCHSDRHARDSSLPFDSAVRRT